VDSVNKSLNCRKDDCLCLDQVAMSAPPPPPLPRLPPPKAPQLPPQPPASQPASQSARVVQTRDENDYIEPQMVFDNMFDDGPLVSKVNLIHKLGLRYLCMSY
jgi:hypothetical protein